MIDSFNGRYKCLSNFHPSKVKLDGVDYPSVEHAYQAAKALDPAERRFVKDMETPGKAKRAGRKVRLRPDWEQIKISVMENLLRQKFRQPDFKRALLKTGDAELVEGNTWGDRFWGVCAGVGHNHLGKLLMKIREELR